MLNARCNTPECRNPAVTIRYQSPSATAGPNSAQSRKMVPPPLPNVAPPAISAMNTITLIAMSA
jgi:hypothetical protein